MSEVKYTYEDAVNYNGDVVAIRRIEDGACIPLDPTNSDYQAYLKSLETTTE